MTERSYLSIGRGSVAADSDIITCDDRWKTPITRVLELEDIAEGHRAFEARQLFGKSPIRVGGDL